MVLQGEESMEKKKISLIVPCYNEAGNVAAFYNWVKECYGSRISETEFVFVDDGRKDDTYKELKKKNENKGKEDVTVISFSRNFGKESGIFAGLEYASGKYVCIIDADLQQSPEVVMQMENILDNDENIDCVTAFQTVRHEGKVLELLKKTFYKVINQMTEVDFVSGASDFRMFRENVKNAILMLPEKDRFSKGIFSWIGFHTEYLPYEACDRHAGTSKWSFKKLLKYGLGGIMSFTVTPLKCATFAGGVLSIISLIYFLVVLCQKLFMGISIPGYPTLVCLILLLGGIQLIMLGIIGEYLGRTYIEGKNRPVYLARVVLKEEKNEKNN